MNFVMEFPGEATPLNAEVVSRVLMSATSSEQVKIQTATQQLQEWETQRGYFSLLQAAYLNKSLPTEVRYIAIIQLKNGVDKFWRKSAKNSISSDEKATIRSHLLDGGISEEERNLALQNALLLSKIVRIDYPNEWPEVLPNLIKIIRESRHSNRLRLQRGMLMLLQLVKELASARLRSLRSNFTLIAEELVFLLSEIYVENLVAWSTQKNELALNKDVADCSLISLKILRRLVIAGHEYPNKSSDIQRLWEYSQVQFGQFLEINSNQALKSSNDSKIMVEEHLLQLSKLHMMMAKQHPAAFALLPSSLELVRAYWGLITNFAESYSSHTLNFGMKTRSSENMRDSTTIMEKLCLKGLNILRACIRMVFNPLQSFKYRSPEIKVEQKKATDLIRTQLLSDSLIQQVANLLVTRLLVFRQIDLDAWEEDHEGWELKEEGAGAGSCWEFEIKSCSEKLFTDLVINYKTLLLNPLLSIFNSVANMGQGQDTILTKDAVYTAMGLSAPVIFKDFNFDTFLSSTIVNDVQTTGPGFKILRRRIAILIGQWVTIELSEKGRLMVYKIFQHLLNAEDETNDRVVQITAARNFKCVVDDFNFDAKGFVPFTSDILGRIMALAREVDAIETKIVLLDTIRSVANRLENNILPFADHIISMLASFWELAEEEYLLKQSIFSTLSTIVVSLQSASDRYYSLIIPLIANSISLTQNSKDHLLEDALDLWANVLETTSSTVSPEILSLADAILPLLEIGSDELRNILKVLEIYCILAPQHMLSDKDRRIRTLSYLSSFLGTSKREFIGLVTTIVEILIRAAEKLGGSEGVLLITQDLHSSGFLVEVFASLRDAWEAHQSSGPEKRYPKLDDAVETDYFTIIARLAVADPNVFANMLTSMGTIDETWSWLSTEWFHHFDCMTNMERRKLSCIALTRMLELPSPVLDINLAKLQDFFTIWTQTISELTFGSEDYSDCLIWKAASNANEKENMDVVRRREWAAADIVHKVSLHEFVKAKLAHVVEVCGGEKKFMDDWIINIDESVLKDYRALEITSSQVN
ncbi:putative importin-beta domain-containing protein [Erysiphe necator]|uniref:Putative importin-beta domain-containing protein n=1 Tax=Uncinula necator TaxID=52586 RepID=A0A0B1P4C2_UNCNE|nr:putative importin-beta domain-containing protein [Erysiphe necator]